MNTNLDFPTDIDFLEKLKSHSAAAHKKLENLSVSTSILSPDMKITDYGHYLSLMYNVHKSTEEIIFPILNPVILDLKEREKTKLLEKDLSYLNYKKNEEIVLFKSSVYSVPFALGIVYVIEGSSLGGRYILKNVEKVSGLNEQKGVSYFTGYGDKTGSYWKGFINLLQEYEAQNNCADEIIEGAVYAFESIYNHFKNTVKNEN